jgi:hypothetical protein
MRTWLQPFAIPAGWYQDPIDPARARYYDGRRWTDDTRAASATDPPPIS